MKNTVVIAKANPAHADSTVDACGYLSLAGELST
jgi:hypothetical protein